MLTVRPPRVTKPPVPRCGRLWWRCGLLWALLGGVACGRRATVVHRTGTVEHRPGAPSMSDAPPWSSAYWGYGLGTGSLLRTGRESRALLWLHPGGRIEVAPETLLRLAETADSLGIQLQAGRAVIESGDAALGLLGKVGRARLEAGGRVELVVDGDGTLVRVLLGQAELIQNGDVTRLVAGATGRLDVEVGRAQVETEAKAPTYAVEVSGRGVRHRPEGTKKWLRLRPGRHALFSGTALRLARKSTVVATTEAGRATLTAPAAATLAPRTGTDLSLSSGTARVRAAGVWSTVVPGGVVLTPKNATSEARVDADKDAHVVAHNGVVTLRGTTRTDLVYGERGRIDRDGTVRVEQRLPAHAVWSIRAGASLTVHDPEPPTSVAIQVDGICTGDAVVRSGSRKRPWVGRSAKAVHIPFAVGRAGYRVHCLSPSGVLSKQKRHGVVEVRRDLGRIRMPKHVARSTIRTDGRKYSVLYQNRLPSLVFRWPLAPPASSFQLHLQAVASGKERSWSLNEASVVLKSGEVPEGDYLAWFAPGDAASDRIRSPKTPLRLDFDNAAPAAYLRAPREARVPAGTAVTVSGVTLAGSTVQSQGQTLSLDRHHRFHAELMPQASARAFAIEIVHPRLGRHVYLRRFQQATPVANKEATP